MPWPLGTLIGGKYRLEQALAEGGMGSIWVAWHVDLEVEVALKFMTVDLLESTDGASRFKREAKAAAKLKSPHVTQIHDYGVHEGTPYIAMELLEGEDLDDLLERRKKLEPALAAELLVQLARGLQVAHDAGLVHRDIKPSNVFLARSGQQVIVKVLDFGIAKETTSQMVVGERTSSGMLLGSPRYMSPEQARGGRIALHSDLWAVGALLFETLTGEAAFKGEHLGDIIAAICADDLPVPSAHAPELPPEIDDFFTKALARRPQDRFTSITAMAEAFTAIVTPEPLSKIVATVARPSGADISGAHDRGRESATVDQPGLADPLAFDDTAFSDNDTPPKSVKSITPQAALSSHVDTQQRLARQKSRKPIWFAGTAVAGIALFWLFTEVLGGNASSPTTDSATTQTVTGPDELPTAPSGAPTTGVDATATAVEPASTSSATAIEPASTSSATASASPPAGTAKANPPTRIKPRRTRIAAPPQPKVSKPAKPKIPAPAPKPTTDPIFGL